MDELLNKIICGDCIEILSEIREPFADLITADLAVRPIGPKCCCFRKPR
ncbi:MAG: site-specific DNA-methyltransferase [Sedimentisphaerales bacterium]|nr:site-specific DNA-methyltransferase [Sedimentisphaerales bacterium]